MKVLHIITGMQKAAGTSVFCGRICTELVKAGQVVTIACYKPTADDRYAVDSRVKWIAFEDVFKDAAISDIVHIHALWSPVLHRVAKWARQNKIPVVWSPHGMLQKWALKNKWWKKLPGLLAYQWWDLHSAVLLHATAQSEGEDIRRLGLNNKVVVAPLGVDLPQLNNQILNQSSNTKILLFVSRVQKKKGLPNLIDAWSRLPIDLRKCWRVRIVGPDEDNHTVELKTKCAQRGVEFEFVGPKYDDDLTAEYFAADLFVLPTHSENFGSVVIEALAHGVPVITTKRAPWAELDEFNCGWWVDDDVVALTAALHEAMTKTDLINMGARGRKLVAERYTWPAVCDRMIKGYEEALNGRA